MSKLFPLLTLLLCASASAQLRADIQHGAPAGQATMRVYDDEKLLFQATTQGLNAVTESKFSPDGKWLLNIADGSGYVQLWNIEKGERVKTFLAPGHQYRLNCADFTPDSQRVLLNFLGERDSQILPPDASYFTSNLMESSLWDVKNLKRLAIMSLPKRESAYNGYVQFSANGERMVFTDADTGPVSVWNARTGALIATLPRLLYPKGAGQTGGAGTTDARLSPDGLRALVRYVDGRLAEYDATTGKLLKVRGKAADAAAEAALEQFAQSGK